jgi:hypothetical protein
MTDHNLYHLDDPQRGFKIELREGRAGIVVLEAAKELYPDNPGQHKLFIGIYKTTLYGGCKVSSKIFPLVVTGRESRQKQFQGHIYSFDNNGILLSHGFRSEEGEEKHDFSLDWLVENGEAIKQMIADCPMPIPFAIHTTVTDLRSNTLRLRR